MVRFKNRYLLCVVDHDAFEKSLLQQVSSRSILTAVRSSLQSNFGDVGAGYATPALAIKYWSDVLGLCLIRASRDHFRSIWASTSMITHLDSLPETVTIRFRVIHVGGTIRSCQKAAAAYARELILIERDAGRKVHVLQSAAESARREMDTLEQ